MRKIRLTYLFPGWKLDSLSPLPSPASEIRVAATRKGKIEAETGLHFSMKTFLMRFSTEPIHNLNNRKLEPRSLRAFNPLDLASNELPKSFLLLLFFFLSFLPRRIIVVRARGNKILRSIFAQRISFSRESFLFLRKFFRNCGFIYFSDQRWKMIIIILILVGREKLKFRSRNQL